MRTISKGDILMGNKIPITIGIEQPFENADDFYMLKEEDDGKCVVIGRVHMASKYKTINVQPERDETDPNVLQYFTDLGMEKSSMGKTFWFGPKFDTFSLLVRSSKMKPISGIQTSKNCVWFPKCGLNFSIENNWWSVSELNRSF